MTELEKYIDALRYERLMWKVRYFRRTTREKIRQYIEMQEHDFRAIAERKANEAERAARIAEAYERRANRIKTEKEKQNEKK